MGTPESASSRVTVPEAASARFARLARGSAGDERCRLLVGAALGRVGPGLQVDVEFFGLVGAEVRVDERLAGVVDDLYAEAARNRE